MARKGSGKSGLFGFHLRKLEWKKKIDEIFVQQ